MTSFTFHFQNKEATMPAEISNHKSILLVEDDPRDAELTLSALEEDHLASKVALVSNGAEALDYLYRRGTFKARTGGPPILVMLDLKMPLVNGLEVLQVMKGDGQLRTIPVVVLTSSREPVDLSACYQHGANAYVVQPLDFSEFMTAIKQLGVFWTAVNEPPPIRCREHSEGHWGNPMMGGKERVENEIAAAHSALRG
ncbi:MAG TPA: response regulator [Candidatus Saccharimonadales bacterium]|nr:response regulator [Candidatus Saccharimonadales bacterium]